MSTLDDTRTETIHALAEQVIDLSRRLMRAGRERDALRAELAETRRHRDALYAVVAGELAALADQAGVDE